MSEPTTTPEPTPETTSADGAAPESEAPKPTETVDFWKQKAREQEKRAKENAKAAERLAALEESQKTESQKLAERAEAAERSAQEAQRELSRLRVLSEVSLPAELHEFVIGNDEDELRAKAQKLKAQFTAGAQSIDVGQGPRGTQTAPSMSQLIRQAAGRA